MGTVPGTIETLITPLPSVALEFNHFRFIILMRRRFLKFGRFFWSIRNIFGDEGLEGSKLFCNI